MALAPKFAGQAFSADVSPKAIHTIELCFPPQPPSMASNANSLTLPLLPQYSAKMFTTLHTSILPTLSQKYPRKVQFIFRQQIQPWHPSSTLCHEAGAAVLRLAPEKFWDFSKALFDRQKEFFD
ncbi:MAG: hypothetical protein Q9207_008396, partial [Kuettlingeria erythrocarpa]